MSFFGDLFDFVVDSVVEVVETTGTIAADTVGFAGNVAGGMIDIAIDVVEGAANLTGDIVGGGIDITGELIAGLIGVILSSDSSDEEREAAERRHERQMAHLRAQSDNTVKQYQQQQQQVYQHQFNYAVNQQQKQLRHQAFKQLHHERDTVRLYISQLKPRKNTIKIQLDACNNSQQRTQLIAEIRALNSLLNPLYQQLKTIKAQLDQLHQNN